MAPIDLKRDRDEEEKEEQPAAKAPKLEASAEAAADAEETSEDEVDAADLDLDDDEDEEVDEFTAEHFDDIEIDAATLEKFNEAWGKFQEDCDKLKNNKFPVVLGCPTQIRPVPTEAKEIWAELPMLLLSEEAQKLKDEIMEKILDTIEEGDEQLEEKEAADEAKEEDFNKIISEQGLKQIELLEGHFKPVKELIEKPELEGLFEKMFILTDFIFDDGQTGIFAKQVDHAKVEAFLKSVVEIWNALFKKSDEELKISAKDRKTVVGWLNTCGQQLRDGELNDVLEFDNEEEANEAAAKEPENPWKDAEFFKFE